MNLKEALLYCGDVEGLKELAQQAGIQSENVLEQADQAAAWLLKPEVMRTRLRIFHDEDMAFMRNVIERGPMVPVKANYDSADRIRNAQYGFATGRERKLEIPEDAAAVFQTIDTKQFNEERQMTSWIYDCLRVVPYLYGIMKREDFCGLCHCKKSFVISNEEVLKTVDSLLQNNKCPVHKKDDLLIRNGLEENGMFDKLTQIHEGIAPKYPSYSELKVLLEKRWPAGNASWQRLYRYLMHDLKDQEEADYAIETIWTLIASSATYSEVNQSLKDELNINKDDNEWKAVLSECWMHTPMLLCNGYTPDEGGLDPALIFLH